MIRTCCVVGLLFCSFGAGMLAQTALQPVAAAPKAPGWVVGCSPAAPPIVTPLTEVPTVVIPATLIAPPPPTATGTPPTAPPAPTYPTLIATPWATPALSK